MNRDPFLAKYFPPEKKAVWSQRARKRYATLMYQMGCVWDHFGLTDEERKAHKAAYRRDRSNATTIYKALYASLQVEVGVPDSGGAGRQGDNGRSDG